MKVEYRVIKRVMTMPVAMAEYGWYEIRQIYFEGDAPRTGGMDRGVHGSSPETLLEDFANYQLALLKPVLVILDDVDRGQILLREDAPLATILPHDKP